jgi:hypothetical protein
LKAAGTLPLPPPPPSGASHAEWAEAMGVAMSHPNWIVRRWLARFGIRETAALLRYNNACVA